jgi:thiol-disulfide isomerase/thioredoxin
MKKILSLLLVAAMFASLMSVSAMADDGTTIDFDGVGVTLTIPDSYFDTNGILAPTEGEELGYNTGWFYLDMGYVAMTQDEYEALLGQDELTDADIALYRSSLGTLFSIYAVADGASLDGMIDMLRSYGLNLDTNNLSEIHEGNGYTFYLYDDPTAADTASFRPEFSAEFRALQADTQQIISSAKFYPPVKPYAELEGKALHFTTTDINGNTVTSEELFGSHDITMLNAWASWCGPCIGELQELEALNGRLAAKNAAVVGLLIDGDDPDAVETARQILREKGVTYTVILPPDNIDDLFEINAYPTSFFVGKDTALTGSPVIGAQVDVYESAIDGLLSRSAAPTRQAGIIAEAGAGKGAADAGVTANDAGMYRIYVADESGKPVEGATVQFCSDSSCLLGKTDAQGLASFSEPEGNYTVHILKVPAEFEKNTTEYTMPGTYSDLSIVLKLK